MMATDLVKGSTTVAAIEFLLYTGLGATQSVVHLPFRII